jgi:hypothetical protein
MLAALGLKNSSSPRSRSDVKAAVAAKSPRNGSTSGNGLRRSGDGVGGPPEPGRARNSSASFFRDKTGDEKPVRGNHAPRHIDACATALGVNALTPVSTVYHRNLSSRSMNSSSSHLIAGSPLSRCIPSTPASTHTDPAQFNRRLWPLMLPLSIFKRQIVV